MNLKAALCFLPVLFFLLELRAEDFLWKDLLLQPGESNQELVSLDSGDILEIVAWIDKSNLQGYLGCLRLFFGGEELTTAANRKAYIEISDGRQVAARTGYGWTLAYGPDRESIQNRGDSYRPTDENLDPTVLRLLIPENLFGSANLKILAASEEVLSSPIYIQSLRIIPKDTEGIKHEAD